MIYGCDAAAVPDAPTLARIRARGWAAWFGYLGGVRAMHAYTPEEWQRIDAAGFGLAAVFVGRNLSDRPGETWDTPADFTEANGQREATDMLAAATRLGFPADAPIGLDVEGQCSALGPELDAYVQGVGAAINGAGRKFLLYSSTSILARYGPDVVDLKWGADWSGTFTPDPPAGQYDPTQPPPWDAWQYAGGSIEGASVDVNSARDDFPFFRLAASQPPPPEPDYRTALASVTAEQGEIVPALRAVVRQSRSTPTRAAVGAVVDRLLAINQQFKP